METYENSFFRPKPNDKRKCCHELDEPCKLDAFACTKTWWETNIKKYIQMAESEYKNKIEIEFADEDMLAHIVEMIAAQNPYGDE